MIRAPFLAALVLFIGGCTVGEIVPPDGVTQPTSAAAAAVETTQSGLPQSGFFAVLERADGQKTLSLPDPDNREKPFLINAIPVVSSIDIARATPSFSQDGMPNIQITLTPQGRTSFGIFTGMNVGKKLAIVVDGRVLSAPIITSPINGGEVEINGRFTVKEAARLAIAIKVPTSN
jgi:preprotein translocase subunit SecD